MSSRPVLVVILAGASAVGSGVIQRQAVPDLIRHYVFFGSERSRISDSAFLATPAIAGAQLKYTWRELEPRPGRYDFSAIQQDLWTLSRAGKRLFVQLQDVSFTEGRTIVPDYLLQDPRYGGGVAAEYRFEGNDDAHPIFEGWVARRWDPAVRARLVGLLRALGERFDGRIAGINLAETSVGFGESGRFHPPGFTNAVYFQGILELMAAARGAFRRSDVIIYANFMPGEEMPGTNLGYLRGVYSYAEKIGVGVGGPDLLPYRWFQRQNSLPLIAKRPAGTVAGLAVQDGNLADRNPKTGLRITVGDLVRIARDELHLDYIFWGTQEPYWSHEVLPFLRAQPRAPGRMRERPNLRFLRPGPEASRPSR